MIENVRDYRDIAYLHTCCQRHLNLRPMENGNTRKLVAIMQILVCNIAVIMECHVLESLRLLDTYASKIAKICDLKTFWPLIPYMS